MVFSESQSVFSILNSNLFIPEEAFYVSQEMKVDNDKVISTGNHFIIFKKDIQSLDSSGTSSIIVKRSAQDIFVSKEDFFNEMFRRLESKERDLFSWRDSLIKSKEKHLGGIKK